MATEKQKKAIERVVENRGNVSKSMREAGYTDKSAKNPKNLTESKAWADLMEKVLPDQLLADRHLALLNKKEVRLKNNVTEGTVDTIETGEIDAQAVSKGLDMAYKLKGRYSATKVALVDPYEELEDDDLETEIARRHSNRSAAK